MDKQLKPAINVGFGPLMISGVTFLISIISMTIAENIPDTSLGISLIQLASSANFVSLSALSAAIIMFSVAFANNTPGIKSIIVKLIIAFILFFIIEVIVIYFYQQSGTQTWQGITLQQLARIFNFIALSALIAAISIPTMDYFTNQWEIKIKV